MACTPSPGDLAETVTDRLQAGAGFIGSHLARCQLGEGYEVPALDRLDPEVHPGRKRPAHLDGEVELIEGMAELAAWLEGSAFRRAALA